MGNWVGNFANALKRQSFYGPIGLDIGTYAIKMVQLAYTSQGQKVQAAANHILQEGQADNEHTPLTDLIPIIKRMLEMQPFIGKKVVCNIPCSQMQIKSLRLPKMPTSELATAVQWEASQRLRVNPTDYQIQYYDAGVITQGDEQRKELIVLAAKNEVVQTHLQLMTQSQLEPVAIDVDPGALRRLMAMYHNDQATDQDPQPHVVLDIGHRLSKVLVCQNDHVLFFKTIDIGGKQLQDKIAEHTDASADEDTPSQATQEAITPAIKELAREVSLCLRYFSVTFRGKKPSHLHVVGGQSKQALLMDVLGQHASLPVKPLEIPQYLDITHTPELAMGDRGDRGDRGQRYFDGQWAVALGLAQRQVRGNRYGHLFNQQVRGAA